MRTNIDRNWRAVEELKTSEGKRVSEQRGMELACEGSSRSWLWYYCKAGVTQAAQDESKARRWWWWWWGGKQENVPMGYLGPDARMLPAVGQGKMWWGWPQKLRITAWKALQLPTALLGRPGLSDRPLQLRRRRSGHPSEHSRGCYFRGLNSRHVICLCVSFSTFLIRTMGLSHE